MIENVLPGSQPRDGGSKRKGEVYLLNDTTWKQVNQEVKKMSISEEDRNYLEEVADGAWGDDPRTRGLARDRLKEIEQSSKATDEFEAAPRYAGSGHLLPLEDA